MLLLLFLEECRCINQSCAFVPRFLATVFVTPGFLFARLDLVTDDVIAAFGHRDVDHLRS